MEMDKFGDFGFRIKLFLSGRKNKMEKGLANENINLIVKGMNHIFVTSYFQIIYFINNAGISLDHVVLFLVSK